MTKFVENTPKKTYPILIRLDLSAHFESLLSHSDENLSNITQKKFEDV